MKIFSPSPLISVPFDEAKFPFKSENGSENCFDDSSDKTLKFHPLENPTKTHEPLSTKYGMMTWFSQDHLAWVIPPTAKLIAWQHETAGETGFKVS